MNKIKSLSSIVVLALSFITGNLSHAAMEYKYLPDDAPEEGLPAFIGLEYLKTCATGDREAIITFCAPGKISYRLFTQTENGGESYIEGAANINWDEKIRWGQEIAEDEARVRIRYYKKDTGKRANFTLDFVKVDGAWLVE